MSAIRMTGALSGIGKATAERVLNDGHTVCISAGRTDAMQNLQAKGAIPRRLDVTREEEIEAVVAQIKAEYGGLDVLINNAGFGMYCSVEETTMEDARYQFDLNLFGMARLTQLVIPLMRAKRRGTIINTSSVGACTCPWGRGITPQGPALRHQRSAEVRGEGIEVIEWLITGRGQPWGAKVHPSS